MPDAQLRRRADKRLRRSIKTTVTGRVTCYTRREWDCAFASERFLAAARTVTASAATSSPLKAGCRTLLFMVRGLESHLAGWRSSGTPNGLATVGLLVAERVGF